MIKQFSVMILFILMTLFFQTPRESYAASDSAYEIIVLYKKGESPRELEEQIMTRRQLTEISDLYKTSYAISDFASRFAKKATPEQKLTRLIQTEKQTGVISKLEVQGNIDDQLTAYVLTLNGLYKLETVALYLARMPEVAYIEGFVQ